ncbi:MAG: membrane dipeptidase, partial [Proteobacteria bacterium]|nr:membrane dipeptidase [Pseudomonadota bacterium]
RVKKHASEQGLRIATTPADLERAAKGEPHIVLAVEGASFLDDDPKGLEFAYEAGVRHVQLVHYIRNGLGDIQTEAETHHGLTDTGHKVIEAANRLGMLVDAAHATEATTRQALEVSKTAIVWSHGSVTDQPSTTRDRIAWKARKISLATAKMIAEKGGVVGLWGLRSDVGDSVEDYAERLMQMARWLGDEHVAFGSDMNAIANSPVGNFSALRQAFAYMAEQGVGEAKLHNITFANYARVLGQAMEKAHA